VPAPEWHIPKVSYASSETNTPTAKVPIVEHPDSGAPENLN
jgi:hypothetical protein